MRIHKSIFLLALGLASGASAQSWDNSGNGLLKGTYYFRHVVWFIGDSYGDLGDAFSIYNTITFDGNGNYTVTGATLYDAYENETLTFSVNGTYSIAASGYGFLQSPASQFIGEELGITLSTPDLIYGMVSNGIFMGAATEQNNSYNDMFIAAPVSSATASTFSGSYSLTGMDAPGLGETEGVAYTLDYYIQGSADGKGNFNVSQAGGYIGANGGSATEQNGIGDAKYSFSNGAASINFNNNLENLASTAVVAGQHFMYISPDGNFVFGGEPYGWDFFVGVRTGSSTTYSGLYYQTGMDTTLTSGGAGGLIEEEEVYGLQDSYFSSFKANSVADQRLNSQAYTDSSGNVIPFDYTYIDDVTVSGNAGDDGFQHYYYSSNGQYRVGVDEFANTGVLGFSIAMAAPTFSGSGLALDPTGIVNTGSNAPFTARITPGELITLYGQSGSTLANGSADYAGGTMPVVLDNTQVMVNNVNAPVLAVNECGSYPCVTFQVPYETVSPGIADIQLVNQGQTSNTISAFVGYTAPGLFTLPQFAQGSGNMQYVAAVHVTPNTPQYGTVVSPSNPAQINETVALFLTGIGPVTPSVGDGVLGPTSPLASPENTFDVYLSSTSPTGAQEVEDTPSFIGLAPAEVGGLAQINLTIPSGITSGDNVVEIVGPDSDTYMALISVSSTAVSAARTPGQTMRRARRAVRQHTFKSHQLHAAALTH